MSGKAGKFNLIPLMLTAGALLGLLSVASIVVDCLLLHLCKKREFYHKLKRMDYKDKYRMLDEEEAGGGKDANEIENPTTITID